MSKTTLYIFAEGAERAHANLPHRIVLWRKYVHKATRDHMEAKDRIEVNGKKKPEGKILP